MSPEYIRDRLFHSFAQENPLSQGTGLGLSIVRQIVDSLGGNIDVQSELNKGTKITVSCRLQNVSLPLESLSMPPDPLISNIIGCSAGMKVAVVGFDEVSRPETFAFTPLQLKQGSIATIVRKALESICREWYGMVLVPWNGSESTSPDLFVATEGGVETLRSRFGPNAEYRGTPRQGQGLAKPPPVIVICNAASSSHSSRNTLTTAIHEQTFEYIAQPCGPRKFGKALAACLNRDSGRFDEHRPQHVVAGAEITERLRNVAIVELPSPPRLNLGDLPTQVTVSTRSPAVRNSVPTDTNKQKQTENVRPSIPQSQSSPNLNVSSTIRIPTLPPHHVPLSILAVDDNPINLTLLRHWVLRLGHNPITATNGADAVSKYKFHCTSAPATIAGLPATPPSRFDAVLMDISMPHMDGMEATRQIRAHEAQLGLKPAKIIALTGLASAQAQQEAFSSGIDMFLTKPIRQRELEAALRDVGIREANEDEEATIVGEAEEEATVVGEDE
jgi:CheY-like chemotaxis protein